MKEIRRNNKRSTGIPKTGNRRNPKGDIEERRTTPARLAREQAGLTIEEAAGRARCSVAYLRALEPAPIK